MPTIKYLGTEIQVRPGTTSSGETAFTHDDGIRVFLGGLAEAKTFLRERKLGRFYGPRPASWEVKLDNGAASLYGARANALSTFEYFVADGRGATLARTEYCSHPGCDGHGDIRTEAKRGARFGTVRPCPNHDEPTSTVEMVAPMRHAPEPHRGGPTLPCGPGEGVGRDDGRGLGHATDACDHTADC